ncbi:MAG: AsmA family protein [Burkholderiaceae bacterium]
MFATCEILGWRFMRDPLSRSLTAAAGAPVRFDGEFKLHVLGSPRLSASSLVVGVAQGVQVAYLVRADDLNLGWRWLDVWRAMQGGTIVIKRLSALQLQVNLVRLKDGRASWAFGTKQSAGDTPWPRVEMLHLSKGEGTLIDETTATKLALTVNSTADGRGMDAIAQGSLHKLLVNITAHADDTFALVQGDGESQDVAVRVDGKVGATTVHYEGKVGALQTARRLDGRLRLRSTSLASVGEPLGLTLPQTPPFDLQGTLTHQGDIWQLDAQKFLVGSSALGGKFKFDSASSPPMLTGQLSGSRLLLVDLGPSIGGTREPAASAGAGSASRRVLPDKKFDLPSLSVMNAHLDVDIAQLDLNTSALAPLSKLQAIVDLKNGVLAITSLQAQAPGGKVSGSMQLDGRGDSAKWTADVDFSGVDVARWLRIDKKPAEKLAAATGKVMPAKAPVSYLTGELDAKLKVTGTGHSTAEIIGSLDGKVDALIKNGTISHLLVEAVGLDLAQGLGLLIGGDDALPMRCARVQLMAKNGLATVERGVIDNKDTTILMTGNLSLREETLSITTLAKPKDVSLFTLRSPIHITGPWSSPNVKLQGDKLAGKAIAAIVLGAIAGPAALLPFVDLGSEETADPCTRTAKAQR